VSLPKVKSATIDSIIHEVYAKNKTFGIEEFMSNMDEDNRAMTIVLYPFIESISDYMASGDEILAEKFVAASKIIAHLVYKSLDKQMSINEMAE